jgi:hypothetical protein
LRSDGIEPFVSVVAHCRIGGEMRARWFGMAVLTVALLGSPTHSSAQSIRASVLKLSAPGAAPTLDAKQWSFRKPPQRRSGSRRKRVLMGTVIGAVGGMLAGIPYYRYCSDEGGSDCRYTLLYTGAIGAGVGAAIGAR